MPKLLCSLVMHRNMAIEKYFYCISVKKKIIIPFLPQFLNDSNECNKHFTAFLH